MLRGTLFSYFETFLLIFLNCNICYSQPGGIPDNELDNIVEYVKTHETFFSTVTTVPDRGLVIGYSFLMTALGTPNEATFNSLFGGTPDYNMVRNGDSGINEDQATQLLKKSLEQVIQRLDNEGILLSSYSLDVKKGLLDAEFAMILPSEVKPLLTFDPAWQRICLSVRTASEDYDARCFDNCRIICPVPVYVDGSVSSYDSCTDQLLFPFGLNFMDNVVPNGFDGSSGRIEILTSFLFYDIFYDSLFVNINGFISLDEDVIEYTPEPFPLPPGTGRNRPIISAFWADVDTNIGGTIYYREMTRRDDEYLAQRIDKLISQHFVRHRNFELIWYLVATWDHVTFFGRSSNQTINNTFQAILVTDGRFSFTIFNYGDIQWTTGTDIFSDGDSYGLGGTQAQVGFNGGDGMNYYSVPGSQTHEIVNIEETSNVGITGRYIFEIGGESVVGSGCNNGSEFDVAGSLILYPSFGSMLGGIEIEVQGPCFQSDKIILCKFIDKANGPETQCIYKDERTVSCVVPILLRTGRVHVFISTDGDKNYGFRGLFTSVNIDEDMDTKVQVFSGSRSIIWPYKSNLGTYYDIDILVYDDESTDPTTMEIVNVEKDEPFNVPDNNVFEYTFSEDFMLQQTKHVGIIRVSQGEEEPGNQNGLPPSYWSDPFDLSVFTPLNVQKWCSGFNTEESYNPIKVSASELRCPCNIQSALLDRGRFSPSPRCSSGIADSCSDEDNIIHCVRSISPSIDGHGLECCYNRDGEITNIDDNLDSGYAHRFHHLGREPFDISGRVPYLSHFTHDILPYIRCCNNVDDCRSYFIPVRPSQGCQGYEPPTPARMNGDPHIQTLDGLAYTFNGHGEYVLMNALNGLFVMQGRTEPLPDTDNITVKATRFTAIAAQYNNDTKVHVTLNVVRGLVAYVTEDNQWSRISFDESPIWKNTGIEIIYTKGTNETNVAITVAFDFGLVFTVEAVSEVMSIVVVGPETMRENTTGLLGNWNGNATDDLRTPDGDLIPSNSSTETIHYNFGEKWRVVSEESVLYYTFGTSYKTYNQTDFEPWFELPNNINETEVKKVCGDNFECIFDYQVTGNAEIAKVTKEAVEIFEDIQERLKPVVSCGFVSTPLNGSKNGSVYTEGSLINFSCNEDLILNGSSIITCSEEGFWSDSVPICMEEESVPTTDPVEEEQDYLLIVISVVIGSVVLVVIVGVLLTWLCKTTRTQTPMVYSNKGAGKECHTNPVYGDVAGEALDAQKSVYQESF